MSRFIEVLNEHRGELTMRTMPSLLHDLKKSSMQRARASRSVSRTSSSAQLRHREQRRSWTTTAGSTASPTEGRRFVISVRVPVTSLCPCSKAISDYGAHNQRGYISIEVRSEPNTNGRPT